MYKQDYDEKLPHDTVNSTGPYTDSHSYGWADAMQPYLKNTQIFQCPSETRGPDSDPASGQYSDYWCNLVAAGKSDATFDAPTLTVLIGDGGSAATAPTASTWTGSSRAISDGDAATCVGGTGPAAAVLPDDSNTRHLDGANVAFADGHVKWQKGVANSSTSAAIKNQCTGINNNQSTFSLSSADIP